MAKSNLIIGIVSFILMLAGGLASAFCCLASPLLAVALGLAAGFLCSHFEKPAAAEQAAVRGTISGAVTGAVALVAHFIGQTVGQLALGANAACLPGMCVESAEPISRTSATLFVLFTSCFYGLLVLAIMAGLGAIGGVLWMKTLGKSKAGAADLSSTRPPAA
jgi:hypothetical protein